MTSAIPKPLILLPPVLDEDDKSVTAADIYSLLPAHQALFSGLYLHHLICSLEHTRRKVPLFSPNVKVH